MTDVHSLIGKRQRTAEKNRLLKEGADAAFPYLAAGDIPGAVDVLQEHAPKIDRLLEQERLYSESEAR